MPTIGVTELLIILVIVLVVFGADKLAGIGKALGEGIREFKSAQQEPAAKKNDEPEKPEEDNTEEK
ncbi:MAG: twin-arginine translocase TatA/TatE family subunit [Vulcanimicrobiota bacterium]